METSKRKASKTILILVVAASRYASRWPLPIVNCPVTPFVIEASKKELKARDFRAASQGKGTCCSDRAIVSDCGSASFVTLPYLLCTIATIQGRIWRRIELENYAWSFGQREEAISRVHEAKQRWLMCVS